jgi:hypothetical protein
VPVAAAGETSSRLPHGARPGPEFHAFERAIKLLPNPPEVPVHFIDPELAPDPDAVRRLDAFLIREPDGRVRQVIYLNSRSAVVRNATGGKDIDLAILAAVIQHELTHLRGAGEPEARRVERDFFQRLIFEGRVPVEAGLTYLADLARASPPRH